MKKKIIIGYIVYAAGSLVWGIFKNYNIKELGILNHLFNIELWMLALLVLLATTLSFWAVIRFGECRIIMRTEAQKVNIDETYINKMDARFKIISSIILRIVMVILSFLSGYAVVSTASLNWETMGTKIYAVLLVSVLIMVTFYGYIYFMVIVMCMRDVYNSDFKDYVSIYPIATKIFEKYTRICSFGLILFWTIGFILILISIIVFSIDAFFIMAVIGILIFAGYLIFMFYPYYLTRKKISTLKMQTIREICERHNMLDKTVFDKYIGIIKYISESPDVMTSNFQLILTSTLAAIAGLITPILSLFK